MAFRTWRAVLSHALGVAAVAGAGQLGIAYGLNLLRSTPTVGTAPADRWPAELAWMGWFAALATIVGAVAADRFARRHGHPTTIGPRFAYATVAGLGTTSVVAPLCMLPARAGSIDAVLAAGLCVGLGAVVGVFAALAVLAYRPLGWNVTVMAAVAWLLALISVLPSVGPTDPLPAVRLGVLDTPWLGGGLARRLVVGTLPALALVAGGVAAALARRRAYPVVVVAACGAVGPALLALPYLLAGPGGAGDHHLATAYWGTLIATAAGAVGSGLATVLPWPGDPPGTPTTRPEQADPVDLSTSVASTEVDRTEAGGPRPTGPTGVDQVEPTSTEPTCDKLTEPAADKGTDGSVSPHDAGFDGEVSAAPEPDTQRQSRTRVPRPRSRRRGKERNEDLPANDAEYVDWISGLAGPSAQPDDPTVRRRLRPSGGHHTE